MRYLAALLVFGSVVCSAWAERDIVLVYQPLSLLGTDLEGDPLKDDSGMAADIFATPTLTGGAYPESIVAALAAPYRFHGAPKEFPAESNLIVLVGGKLDSAWGEKSHTVTIDFSKVVFPENLGVNLKQLCELTRLCLLRSLKPGNTDNTPIELIWKLPESERALLKSLPKILK